MGRDKGFSLLIKSGHVVACFLLWCLFPFESIREKSGRKKLTEKLAIVQYC